MSARDVIERHLNQKAGLVLTSEANADAILSALDAAGYAVVPKNQTAGFLADNVSDEMVYAYLFAPHISGKNVDENVRKSISAALRAAAGDKQ